MFLKNMQVTGAILGPAENSNLSIAQSPYLIPTNPGFLNKCYIKLPYSRFSTKMCCHALAMEQIYFDKFTSFTSGLLGPVVWWSEVLCPGSTLTAPIFLSFPVAGPGNFGLAACRATTNTDFLVLSPCIKMPNEVAPRSASCIAKCLTFPKSLSYIFSLCP